MCEAGTATQAEAGLFLDMSQSHQIRSLSATGRAGAESPQAARADTDNVTQAADWEVCPVFLAGLNLTALGPRRTALLPKKQPCQPPLAIFANHTRMTWPDV